MRNGLLLVNKEPGFTSHDIVQRVRRLVGQKKVGHCGTLDPDATGLLLLTLGRATRLTRFLIRAPKVYEGVVQLGVRTDTYDASGQVLGEASPADVELAEVERAMEELEGTYLQIPPPYCAKKTKGVKYYELARRGEEVPLEPKQVTVFEFQTRGDLQEGRFAFRLSCASGTYARTLAHDVGLKVGCGGHLAALRRTQIGPFELEDAATIPELEKRLEDDEPPLGAAWIPFDDIPLPFGSVTADAQQERRIAHGQSVLVRQLGGEEGDWIKVLNERQQLIAVGSVVERIGRGPVGIVQPKIVFRN